MKSRKLNFAFSDKYKCVIDWDEEDKIFVCRFPELKGCSSHGATYEEAAANGHEALSLYLDSLAERGIKAPKPIALVKASGNFPVRTEPEIHKQLLMLSVEQDLSMNQLVTMVLKKYLA